MSDLDLEPERGAPSEPFSPPDPASPAPARSGWQRLLAVFHPGHALLGAALFFSVAFVWTRWIHPTLEPGRTLAMAAGWGALIAGTLQDRLWGFFGWSSRKFWDRRLYDLE